MPSPFNLRPRLEALARNLWWSWNVELDGVFRAIDVELWRRVDHNPTAFLRDIGDEALSRMEEEARVLALVAHAEKNLRQYVEGEGTWASLRAAGLGAKPVAYFSPEFCIHESLPIYSGGLGVLAGDHLKSCSDLGIPTYGVSLLYREGYFTQELDADGRQTEVYRSLDTSRISIEQAIDDSGRPVSIEIEIADDVVKVDLWLAHVGRCTLILLDAGTELPRRYPGAVRLYGGDTGTRIVQELILGAGGYRALRALGIRPGVIHMNEGHSAFAALEAIAERMQESGRGFHEASADVVDSIVFTTHTPVEAGHDRFDPGAVLHYLAPLRTRLALSEHDLLALGRVNPADGGERFCMSVLAIKLSRRANAVSSLHGAVSRSMWRSLWPDRRTADVPIGHITNGIHVDTWLSFELARLYHDSMGADWKERMCDPEAWQAISEIDPSQLWNVKLALKRRLLRFAERRLRQRWQRLGRDRTPPVLRLDALTIGVARRFAVYKRAGLLFEDLERVRALLTNPDRPVQIIFAGKAHPADEPGKELIRSLMALREQPGMWDHIVLLEDYDRSVSRHMLEGCDLWLNQPRRPLEACGTSGMKAVYNATLNCSTLDGWWDEAYDTRNGFSFGDGLVHADPAVHDRRDRESLLSVLEQQVVPLFYARDSDGVPVEWIERIKHALTTLGWRYNADRMVREYAEHTYLPAANVTTAEFRS